MCEDGGRSRRASVQRPSPRPSSRSVGGGAAASDPRSARHAGFVDRGASGGAEVVTGVGQRDGIVQREVDFGCVWVDGHLPFLSEMPPGGFKESGYGKDLSTYALDDDTRIKHAMVEFS